MEYQMKTEHAAAVRTVAVAGCVDITRRVNTRVSCCGWLSYQIELDVQPHLLGRILCRSLVQYRARFGLR